jgi:hypothetical protein
VTATHDDLIPDGYYRWPREIQLRYLQELYALYFPGHQVPIGQAPEVAGATPPKAIALPAQTDG